MTKENKLWLGASIHSGGTDFIIPSNYVVSKNAKMDKDGNKLVNIPGPRWFTNVDYEQRYEDLILYKKYTPEEYPKYDNYDAINVDKTIDIPCDYYGVMGVPITFMDKYNPKQFKIISDSRYHDGQDFADDINVLNGNTLYRRILIQRIVDEDEDENPTKESTEIIEDNMEEEVNGN